jgi:adenylate cyclase
MDSTENYRVIMFADVVGSTTLYEALGDSEAQRIIAECLAIAKQSTVSHGGRTVAELGDEIMTMFSDPGDAAAAACEIQAKMADTDADGGEAHRMRIGLHFGPVSGRNDDMMSETAKIAHWAANNAKPEQILGTGALIDVLPRIYQAVSRYVDDETWNFISIEHVAIHEIIWDVESVTAYSGEIPTLNSQKSAGITFSSRNQSVILNSERPVISIGRGSGNDLIVRHDLASRQHLSAQFSRGRCTITDNSTNGTVIFSDHDQTRHDLRRDSFTLLGSGKIVLGQPAEVDDKDAIRYQSE